MTHELPQEFTGKFYFFRFWTMKNLFSTSSQKTLETSASALTRVAEIKKNHGPFQISLVLSVLFHKTEQTV